MCSSVCLSVCVCLSTSISLKLNHWTNLYQTFDADHLWPWLSPDGLAIRYITYVLPVLCLTSCLAVVGRPTTTSGIATLGRSLMSMNALSWLSFTSSSGLSVLTDCNNGFTVLILTLFLIKWHKYIRSALRQAVSQPLPLVAHPHKAETWFSILHAMYGL